MALPAYRSGPTSDSNLQLGSPLIVELMMLPQIGDGHFRLNIKLLSCPRVAVCHSTKRFCSLSGILNLFGHRERMPCKRRTGCTWQKNLFSFHSAQSFFEGGRYRGLGLTPQVKDNSQTNQIFQGRNLYLLAVFIRHSERGMQHCGHYSVHLTAARQVARGCMGTEATLRMPTHLFASCKG